MHLTGPVLTSPLSSSSVVVVVNPFTVVIIEFYLVEIFFKTSIIDNPIVSILVFVLNLEVETGRGGAGVDTGPNQEIKKEEEERDILLKRRRHTAQTFLGMNV